MTISDWCADYLEIADLAPLTRCKYASDYANYLGALGALDVASAAALDVQRWAAQLPPRLSDKSRRNIIGAVLSALHYAYDMHIIDDYITLRAPRRRHTQDDYTRGMDISDYRAIISAGYASDDIYAPVVILGACAGMRLGEILGLQWRDIGADNLYIQRQLLYVPRSGYSYAVPKHGKSRRVYVSPHLLSYLGAQRRWRRVSGADTDTVVCNDTGAHAVHFTARRHAQAIMHAATGGAYTVHDLRHAYATHMLRAGADARTVAAQLGHHSPGFTLRQYVYSTPDAQRTAAARLDSYTNTYNPHTIHTQSTI